MDSVTVYTNLFTIQGNNPKENKYISMFLIWFKLLIKNGGLKSSDRLVVLIDGPTAEALQEYDILSHLIDIAEFQFKAIVIEQPVSLTAGIAKRYTIYDFLEINTIVCHLDVDVMCIKPIRKIICENLLNSDIAIYLEGNSMGAYYLYELKDEIGISEDEMKKTAGITGAIYFFRTSPDIMAQFKRLYTRIITAEKQNITDQPYWNELFWNLRKINYPITVIPDSAVETSLSNLSDDTCLLNLCGEPGDGNFHWQKVLTAYLYLV
jgi:hypothetical protein